MSVPSVTGKELFALLPTVYRVRDERGDLEQYLDACGALLDRVRATLEQRLADVFPENPGGELPAQSWLLPYFADLFDVQLVSPHVEGRRAEVGRAIAWRQRKGTLATIEQIAEQVGGAEVEIQEGWLRVAVTPRVDRTLLPAAAYGVAPEPDSHNPLVARTHPALPAVTVDFTLPSRAVAADAAHPRAKQTKFLGTSVSWRQLNPHGVPCFPGSYEDASPRTPDARTPGPARGHIHPQRLLLFIPPSTGFFPFDADQVTWGLRATRISDPGGDPRVIANPVERAVIITTSPPTFTAAAVAISDIVVDGTIRVSTGRITLRNVAAKKLVVDTTDLAVPVIDAVDCLFDEIEAVGGLVRLEGTTVMKSIDCGRLQASDCIFAGTVRLRPPNNASRSCIRWSRVPKLINVPLTRQPERAALTTAEPIFFAFEHCAREGGSRLNDRFGDPAYGELHPSTPDAIRFGAEDGGEMGAGHQRAACLAHAAILTKLEEFLPLGIEAVLVPDPRLLVAPPRIAP
jgi:hypothetical protein